MRTEKFYEQQQLGLHKLTGDNTGLVYANERMSRETEPDTGKERDVWEYDIYEVHDARDPRKVKNDVINDKHPFGDELKILRKTIRKMMSDAKYNSDEYAVFRAYNEFCESV